MHWYKLVACLLGSALLIGCGVPQSEYDKIKAEADSLRKELDECQFGAERMAGQIEKAYSDRNYAQAGDLIRQLAIRHPESPKNAEFKRLLPEIDQQVAIQKAAAERAEKEKTRLANAGNLGIWEVRQFVDEFREKTSKRYITNALPIRGTFSNSATQDSDLNVEFIITGPSDVSIQLYEYARNNPVKGYSEQTYRIAVKDQSGQKVTLSATNYSDRLSLGSSDSRRLHAVLMKGGEVQFWIRENDTPTTQYQFTIPSADWYNNAFTQLTAK